MLKKSVILLLCVYLIFVVSGCYSIDNQLKPSNGTLFVNGVAVTDNPYVYISPEDRMAIIPMLAIFNALDAEIEHTAQGNYEEITVCFNNHTFTFDTGRWDLGVSVPKWMESDQWNNRCVRIPDGSDLLIDSRSVSALFYHGWGLRILVDYQNSVVNVETIDNTELSYAKEELAKVNCRLIVNGNEITETNYAYINQDAKNAELPVVAIIKALGGTVEWLPCEPYPIENRCIVRVRFNGGEAEFDTSKSDFGLGFLSKTPGLTREVMGNDIIIDSRTVDGILYHTMGINVKIDYETCIIYVYALQEGN